MANTFYPTSINDESFVRAPGRLLYADLSTSFPTQIHDVVNTSTYAPQTGWTDLGATKGGVQVSFNNSEDLFTVDQIIGEIDSLPSGAQMSVQTQLAEATADHLSLAWEGTSVTTNSGATGGSEKNVSFGPFESYTRRRLAVGQRRPSSGKLRLTVFRKVQRSAAESTLTANSTGDQTTIPITFRVLPDTSVTNVLARYCTIFDQV